MAITFPLSLPTVTGPGGKIRSIEWKHETSVTGSQSPFSLKTQYYDWGGKRISAMVDVAPMRVDDAKKWIAFFLSLNGPEGTFWLPPTVDKTASGIATGTPLVNGGSQTGQSIVTDGWTPSQTGILKAGDWIQIGNYIYRILQDANSDGSGNATFDIWPKLRTSPANDDPIIVSNPKGQFRTTSIPSGKFDENKLSTGFKFEAVENI